MDNASHSTSIEQLQVGLTSIRKLRGGVENGIKT